MKADELSLIADLQFVLARILWAPYCDRDRAVLLAELAAKTHPDPDRREAIAGWLQLRATPAIDEIAIAYLQRSLRPDHDDSTHPPPREAELETMTTAAFHREPEIEIVQTTS